MRWIDKECVNPAQYAALRCAALHWLAHLWLALNSRWLGSKWGKKLFKGRFTPSESKDACYSTLTRLNRSAQEVFFLPKERKNRKKLSFSRVTYIQGQNPLLNARLSYIDYYVSKGYKRELKWHLTECISLCHFFNR